MDKMKRWIACCAAVAATATSRLGFAQQPSHVRPGGAALPARGTTPVHSTMSRTLANGCRYVATVDGTLRPTGGTGTDVNGAPAPLYEPELRVGSRVTCEGVATVRADPAPVRSVALPLDAIEGAVEARATHSSRTSGRDCTYLPDFEFVGRTLIGQRVTLHCPQEPASRGGGPAARPERSRQINDGPPVDGARRLPHPTDERTDSR